MQKKIWLVALVFALIWIGIRSKETLAQEKKVEDFYKGATIRFIVPYGPGGGYDTWARTLGPFLEKHTGARVLVENMAGAGGLAASSYLYSIAKPDGLTVSIFPMSGLVIAKMLGLEQATFEIEKFNYLGRLEVIDRALFAGKPSGFKSIADMQKSPRPVHFTTSEITGDAAVDAALISEGFGLKAKIVPGSKGTAQSSLFVVAGRGIDAVCGSFAERQGFVKKGEMIVILFLGKKRNPDYPEVPIALEAPGIKPGGRKYIELSSEMPESGRMILTSPGVPGERLLFLEKALSASLKEPWLVDWAKQRDSNISPLSGKECKELVVKMMGLVPQAERAEFKQIIFEKYF